MHLFGYQYFNNHSFQDEIYNLVNLRKKTANISTFVSTHYPILQNINHHKRVKDETCSY